MVVDDVQLFITNPKVKAALRVAFASLLGVLPHAVIVELRASRRLTKQRRLSGSVTVYYRINLPPGSNAWLLAETMNKITIEDLQKATTESLQRMGIMQPITVKSHTSGSVDTNQQTTTHAVTLGPAPSTTTRYVVPGRTNSAVGNSLIRVGFMCVAFSLGLYFQ